MGEMPSKRIVFILPCSVCGKVAKHGDKYDIDEQTGLSVCSNECWEEILSEEEMESGICLR